MYESLYSLFFKDQSRHLAAYQSRTASSLTVPFHISLKQFGRKSSYPAFLCPCEDMLLLQERILFAYRDCLQIITAVPQVAIKQFLKTCLINEIKSTNDIEGVYSSRKELQEVLNTASTQRQNRRFGSIISKYERLSHLEAIPLNTSQDIRRLYDELLYQEIAQDNPQNLPDGEIFRKSSVDIVSATQKTIHRGLYPESEIITAMNEALGILNRESLPLLVRLAIFHCLFGYIHPFYDGNGRTSRFIASYFLAAELHPTIALQLSVLIKEQKNRYYKMFSVAEAESNRGDLTPFVLGFLELVLQAISSTKEQLQEKFAEYSRYHQLLQARVGHTSQHIQYFYDILLQSTVFSDSGLSTRDLCQILGKSPSTIYGYIKSVPMEHLFILRRGRESFIELSYEFLNSLD